ncbi:MAG: penicillin-insensitive murein endopeptidase [Polyangiaceae bacterium]
MLSRFTRSLFAATCAAALSLSLAAAPALAAKPEKAAEDAKKPGDTKAKKDAKADKKSADKDAKADKDTKKSAADKAKKDDAKADKKGADKDAKKSAADKAKKDDPKADKDAKKSAKKDDKDAKDAIDVKGTASIGAPNKGRLQGGIKLKSSRSLKVREHAHSWGLPALVKLLQRAAGKVAKHHPKSVMLVGDLSQKSGGSLVGHNSHQTGRDADVGFYVANSTGKPAAMNRFVAFDGTGKSQAVTWAQFDDARNWALVEALLTDKDTTVRYIFVSMPLRARVLAFAKKEKVAKDLYQRAETVLMSPRDADVHDDHFHVRIACPEGMKGFCIEESNARGGGASAVATSAKSDAKHPAAAKSDANEDAKTDDAKTDDAKPAPVADAKPAPAAEAKADAKP